MNKDEIIAAIEKDLETNYHIKIEFPYDDTYRQYIDQNGRVVGELNTDGYNLGYCISKLAEIYNKYLY